VKTPTLASDKTSKAVVITQGLAIKVFDTLGVLPTSLGYAILAKDKWDLVHKHFIKLFYLLCIQNHGVATFRRLRFSLEQITLRNHSIVEFGISCYFCVNNA